MYIDFNLIKLRNIVRQFLIESGGPKWVWGTGGAGMIMICPEDRTIFLQKRSEMVTGGGGKYAFPGGGIHPIGKKDKKGRRIRRETHYPTPIPEHLQFQFADEIFYKTACEEFLEETGHLPPHKIVDSYEYEYMGFRYKTFIATTSNKDTVQDTVKDQFAWESDFDGWVSFDEFNELLNTNQLWSVAFNDNVLNVLNNFLK